MKRSFFFLLIALLSAVSCATPHYVPVEPSLQEQWTGRTHAEIVLEFGAPDREISDGMDGTILVYERTTTTTNTSEFMERYTTTIEEKRYFKEFYINVEGICYNVRSNESVQDGNRFSFVETIMCAGILGLAIFVHPEGEGELE